MRNLAETKSVGTFIGDLVFTLARLIAHVPMRDLAGGFRAVLTRGRELRTRREAAYDEREFALAARMAEEVALHDVLLALGRAALDAAGGHEEAQPYARLFGE